MGLQAGRHLLEARVFSCFRVCSSWMARIPVLVTYMCHRCVCPVCDLSSLSFRVLIIRSSYLYCWECVRLYLCGDLFTHLLIDWSYSGNPP